MVDSNRQRVLEPGPGIREGWKGMKFDKNNISSFLVSLVFSLTGAVVVFVNVGQQAGFTTNQTVSFIAFGYIVAGIVSTLLTLYYKQPLLAMPGITAILVIGNELKNFSVQEMVGAFIVTSLIFVILGLTGIIGRIAKILPVPIVMGMIAGAYMSYGTGIITSVQAIPVIGICTVLAFLVTPLISKKIPQQAAALVVGVILTLILVPIKFDTGSLIFMPVAYGPKFNSSMLVSLCIPLVLIGIADFLKSYGILKTNGYEPPSNSMIFFPALGSLLGSFLLAVPMTMTGVITAIISDPATGEKDRRYIAAVLKNIAAVGIGIFSGVLVPFLMLLPSDTTKIFAGLAMLGLFLGSLGGAFGGKKFKIGAFAAFIVTLSGLNLFGVASAVWGVVFGIIVSLFLERKDFSQAKPEAAAQKA
jgi:benzoate membrane transport protein